MKNFRTLAAFSVSAVSLCVLSTLSGCAQVPVAAPAAAPTATAPAATPAPLLT